MDIFNDIERAKNKILEAIPNFERNMTFYQGIEKMCAYNTNHQLYNEKEALFKQLHKHFTNKEITLSLNMPVLSSVLHKC